MGVGADLNVDATVSVLAQENGLLSFPAPAGQESTVDQRGGCPWHLFQGRALLLLDSRPTDCYGGDGSSDGGLRHAVTFSEFNLDAVSSQILQCHIQRSSDP